MLWNALLGLRDLGRQVAATARGQHPVAVVLACIDSRSPAELLFDVGVGEIFSARVAGRVVGMVNDRSGGLRLSRRGCRRRWP